MMMKFVHRLDQLLVQQEGASYISNDTTAWKLWQDWNAELETLLFAEPNDATCTSSSSSGRGESENVTEKDKDEEAKEEEEVVLTGEEAKSQLDAVVSKLQRAMVFCLARFLGVDDDTIAKAKDLNDLDSLTNHILVILPKNPAPESMIISIHHPFSWSWLQLLVRTSSNLLRWYLQVFLTKFPLVYPMASAPFQSHDMLSIMLFLIEYHATRASSTTDHNESSRSRTSHDNELSPSQRFARYTALLLFYATFSPNSSSQDDDIMMQQVHESLLRDHNFLLTTLRILTYPPHTTPALALALIRNVHNVLVSCPKTTLEILQQTAFPIQGMPQEPMAPWSPKQDDNTDGLITYPSIFRDILIWSLNTPDLPVFPGPLHDKRCELVMEILAIIFAMGGTEVARALRYPCPNPALSQLVVTSLQTPLDTTTASSDLRMYRVQLSTIAILMDACPTFGTYLVEQEVVSCILDITQRQIDAVLHHETLQENDDAATTTTTTATTTLIPSLAVLHKFSADNSIFCKAVKDQIFPTSQEEQFWQLAQQQTGGTNTTSNSNNDNDNSNTNNNDNSTTIRRSLGGAKNMHPLDAPHGTLRWKLIRLMTYTETHVKRYTCEFLWVLCNQNAQEFVLRTGLGNAMAFLGVKGMVQLPAGTFA